MGTAATPVSFGALLQSYRAAAGLSQEELAERAGLSRRGISDLERGERRAPHPATVRRLAEALRLAEPDRAALFSATRTPHAVAAPEDQPAPRHLPQELTSFVGREHELAEVRRLLGASRLLTLTGSGGVGKTRLALKVAEEELRTYGDGVWFVELAPLAEAALVPQLVANVLNVRENPSESVMTTLTKALQPLHLLLILDNCEHVLAPCVDLVHYLLRGCPQLCILATSREVLGMGAETIWRVPSLRLPETGAHTTPEQVGESEAGVLFVERARAVQPGFAATLQNARIIADLCRRVDGIPLAIELAASRLKLLAVEQIADRLTDHFRLLARRDRTAPTRQQTVQATIEWSYHLLSDLEQHLFERLSVFAGGWTLEAAEAIGGGEGIEAAEVLDLLERLVDKSLVLADAGADGLQRYRLLEMLRQYGQERLLDRSENEGTRQRHAACLLHLVEESDWPLLTGAARAWFAEAVRGRHAAYFLALAETAEPRLSGPEQAVWLDRLEREHDNLRVALQWLRARGEAAQGLRLAKALAQFWWLRSHFAEGRAELGSLLALPQPAVTRAGALLALGILDYRCCEFDAAYLHLRDSLAMARDLGDLAGSAGALGNLGRMALDQGDIAAARPLLEESLAIHQQLGNQGGVSRLLSHLGALAMFEHDDRRARALLEESLAREREIGDTFWVAVALVWLGLVAFDVGNLSLAVARWEELQASVDLREYRWMLPFLLEAYARTAMTWGRPEAGVRLGGAAEALREALGSPCPPLWRPYMERWLLAPARRTLPDQGRVVAWAEGRAMSGEQALTYARTVVKPPVRERPGPASGSVGRLSPREHEVAVLIARGWTNRQIAQQLVLSERTVETHVTAILGKLGWTSRAQIATWIGEQGLRLDRTEEGSTPSRLG
jgi:predicted ATPase/DNA-binding CsgD family transcriptional regulator/DNA-binding XRE family transcriptional regulator